MQPYLTLPPVATAYVKYRKTILLADVQEEKSMAAALCVGSIKMKAIDDIFDDQEDFPEG